MTRSRDIRLEFKKPADDGGAYALYIYSDIGSMGEAVSAKGVADMVAGVPAGAKLEVHINSDGGSAFDGIAIYNQLKAREDIKKTGIVDGRAYSAASIVLQACDKRVLNAGATLMIHNPLTFMYGNAKDLRAAADDLDRIAVGMLDIYEERSGMNRADLEALADEERILTGLEALDLGFVDVYKYGAKAEEDDEDGTDDAEGGTDDTEDGTDASESLNSDENATDEETGGEDESLEISDFEGDTDEDGADEAEEGESDAGEADDADETGDAESGTDETGEEKDEEEQVNDLRGTKYEAAWRFFKNY